MKYASKDKGMTGKATKMAPKPKMKGKGSKKAC